jgi:hypothetical protein
MAGQESGCQHVIRRELPEGSQVYDMLLAVLFFFVVLSPLVIHAGLNVAERIALRREALNPGSQPAKKKGPRSAWTSDGSTPAVSSAAPSAR